ncbi:MAG: hypothetical protein EP344_19085 [Bacteroidetes bacterium]|nr:MAG: hypothetical protein EP344_19085 [Bacteroidota bacterium]
MDLLLDENMLPSFCAILQEYGHHARHVYSVGLGNAPDEAILDFARQAGDTILTNDLDFSRIMALSQAELPSVITFRLGALNRELFRNIVLLNFTSLEEAVREGSLITIDEGGIRIRKLPVC